MMSYNLDRAAAEAATVRPDRPATAVVHDGADARLVLFHLGPRQEVPRHQSRSAVMLHVLRGAGVLLLADGERFCAAGEIAVFEPDELHGMRAGDDALVILATIAPRPGSR